MFCYILGEAAVDEFFVKYLHLNFLDCQSFLGFQHRSGSLVKAIVLAMLVILGLSFVDPKDLSLANQFSGGSSRKRSVSKFFLLFLP